MVDTQVMLARGWFWDHRAASRADIARVPEHFVAALPLRDSLNLIKSGQFATAHLQYADEYADAMSNFAILFAVRDLRDTLVSHMRFRSDPRRLDAPLQTWAKRPDGPERFLAYLNDLGKEYLDLCREQQPWLNAPGVVVCRYEVAMGDRGDEEQIKLLSRIGVALGLPSQFDVVSVFAKEVRNQETRTYSGDRSTYALYATPEVEAALDAHGVFELNKAYGYN